jgi:Acetyltransferase (GNAT) domain
MTLRRSRIWRAFHWLRRGRSRTLRTGAHQSPHEDHDRWTVPGIALGEWRTIELPAIASGAAWRRDWREIHVDGVRHTVTAGAAGPAPRPDSGSPSDDARFQVIPASDDAAWDAVLARVVEYDFHHLAGYHRLAEYLGEGTAGLFVYRDGEHLIAVPLLLRPINDQEPAGPWDATSVYGYAGPIASHASLPQTVIDGFQRSLREELISRRIVTVFSRLHPLIEQRPLVAGLGETAVCGPTVSIDLTLTPEEQWAGYSKGTRRLIRRATEAGVVCVHEPNLEHLLEFGAMYRETMERVGATSSYFYDDAYFERMAAELGSVMHLFVALVDGRPAACGLFTLCDGIVQAHLGASRSEYAALSPVRLIDDTARRWAVDAGARVLHLGGGLGGKEDGLFQYKAGFSDRRHDFRVWRWVVDDATYDDLCRKRGPAEGPPAACGSGQFFPAYRRPVERSE